MSKKKMTNRDLVSFNQRLEDEVGDLRKFKSDICRQLCFGGVVSEKEILDRIMRLVTSDQDRETTNLVGIAEQRGHQKGVESMYERENKRLWHLLRSLMGDKTLEKEMLRVQDNGLGHVREIVVTPFTENQSYP